MWYWIGALIVTAFLGFSIGLVTGSAIAVAHFREFGPDIDRMT